MNDGVYQSGGLANPYYVRVSAFGKYPVIQSVNGPQATFIKGAGYMCVWLTDRAVLSGFTVMNGTNYTLGRSGGVYCETTNCIVTNCIITGNYGASAGGVMGGTVIDCLLTNNSGATGGAGSNLLFNCTLIANHGGTGGGAAAYSVLNNCVASNNVATGNGNSGADGNGGGLYFGSATDSLISSNRAGGHGGGAYCPEADEVLNHCVLQNNYSGSDGGGASGDIRAPSLCIELRSHCHGLFAPIVAIQSKQTKELKRQAEPPVSYRPMKR